MQSGRLRHSFGATSLKFLFSRTLQHDYAFYNDKERFLAQCTVQESSNDRAPPIHSIGSANHRLWDYTTPRPPSTLSRAELPEHRCSTRRSSSARRLHSGQSGKLRPSPWAFLMSRNLASAPHLVALVINSYSRLLLKAAIRDSAHEFDH